MVFPLDVQKKLSWHNFPFLAENREVTFKDLSPTAQRLCIDKYGLKGALKYKSRKLINSFHPKFKYKIHQLLYKKALELGVKVTKVIEILIL